MRQRPRGASSTSRAFPRESCLARACPVERLCARRPLLRADRAHKVLGSIVERRQFWKIRGRNEYGPEHHVRHRRRAGRRIFLKPSGCGWPANRDTAFAQARLGDLYAVPATACSRSCLLHCTQHICSQEHVVFKWFVADWHRSRRLYAPGLRGVEHLGHGGRESGEQRRGTGVHAVLGVAIRAELEHGWSRRGDRRPSTPECPPRRSRSACRPDPVPGDPI